jgi:mannitol-specific phosphotransferase system IIBC component
MYIRLVSCFIFYFMLLIKFLFHFQIVELEKGLTKDENEMKSMKKGARKKKVVTKEEEAKKSQESTKDMVVRWIKGWWCSGQGCSKDAAK